MLKPGPNKGMAVAFYGSADGLADTPDWVTYGESKKIITATG